MTLPLDKLPPLDQVRSFVAVGRRLSVTVAASELHVTQSAVSRQITALEDAIGARLFIRRHRALAFTPEGERLFEFCQQAMTQLQHAFGEILVPRDQRPVTITSPTGFSSLWLVPRITRLQARHPRIELRITASNRVYDLRSEGIDLAIRYGDRTVAPERAVLLMPETVAPAARPGLLNGPLEHVQQLDSLILLEFDDTARRDHLGWEGWLASRGWSDARPKGILRFNHYEQVISSAIAGQGLALARPELISLCLESNSLELVAPAIEAPGDMCGHWLLAGDPQPRVDVKAVIEWLEQEAVETLNREERRRSAAAALVGR